LKKKGNLVTENIKEQLKTIAFMKDVFSYMSSSDSTATLLNSVHHSLKTLIYADNFFVVLLNSTTNIITFPYYQDCQDGMSVESLSKVSDQILSSSLTSYALKKKAIVNLQKPEISRLMSSNIINPIGTIPDQWLCLPLMHKGEYFGSIVVQSYRDTDEYKEDDIEILTYISDVIATALFFFNENIALSEALICLERNKEQLEEKITERTLSLENTLTSLQSEIIKSKQLEEQLKFDAYHDELTSLYNRKYFIEQLDLVASQVNRDFHTIFLAYMDLDGFKAINDTFGHACGDFVLTKTAERMLSCFRRHDIVARLGGDEFVVLITDATSFDGIEHLFQRLIECISSPLEYQSETVSVGLSIGLACTEQASDVSSHLLAQADSALYQAKEAGKGCLVRYTAQDSEVQLANSSV